MLSCCRMLRKKGVVLLGVWTVFMIVVVGGPAISVLSVEIPLPSDTADVQTLQLVHVIMRHGDRTPIVQYPKDPLKNESLWYPYATGFEALTKKGKEMQLTFGKYLRSRYDGFLSKVYSPKEILVLSSDSDRAIMSALSNMAGLWPPTPTDPKSQWSETVGQLNWQPIPIHTIPAKSDNMINFKADCPRFKELKDEYIRRSEYAKVVNSSPENVLLCNYVKNQTGETYCDFETISDIWDTLQIQRSYNMTLPAWVDQKFGGSGRTIMDKMGEIAPIFFDPKVLVPNEEAKRVKAGPLLGFLVQTMDAVRNPATPTKDTYPKAKMVLISGHDTTNSIALGAIGVFETQFPAYASAAIFEMHKGTRESPLYKDQDYYIRVYYRNQTSVPPYEFQIPKCGYPCKFDMFKKLFNNIIVRDENVWKKSCSSKSVQKRSEGVTLTGSTGFRVMIQLLSSFTLVLLSS